MGMMNQLKQEENVPVVMADQQGLIIYVNKKFEEVFKWKANEVTGKPLTIIIPDNLHDAHNLGFSRFLSTEKSIIMNQRLNLKAVDSEGTVFSAEHHIQSEKIDGEWIFAATIQRIDENQDRT